MRTYLSFLMLLLVAAPLAGCPDPVDDDDVIIPDDDDDATGDDDDATGDDDDATGDDDDSTGDDDDATGDDDDLAGDDDDATGDDDDATGDDDDATGPVDGDGDGSPAGIDCDDADPANFPGNTELCDGGDNDCNAATFAVGEDTDIDADGSITCLDCDDADGGNFPGNVEVCDGGDNDCDGSTFAAGEDTDGDSDGSVTCLDCDDADGANFPGNAEVCDESDNDCDGSTVFAGEDTDGDSDGSVTCLDCDDADGASFPGNAEVCDGQDNDCDAATSAPGGEDDVDGDGSVECLDCDDGDGANFPGNVEVCDGGDNDCNGLADFGDAGDWTMTDSLTGAVSFAPLTLSSPTTLTLADDETSVALPLGFSFSFAGATRTVAHVRSNGWLDFVGQVPQSFYTGWELGSDDDLDEFIAFWFADLNPATGGTVTYGTQGAAPNRVFVVDFASVPYFDPDAQSTPTTETVTVQLQLHESTNIIEVHATQADAQPANITSPIGSQVSLGVEGAPPNADVYIDQDATASLTATAVRWTPSEEVDSDGDGVTFCAGDCGEQDASVNPSGTEVCDGLDNDCVGGPTVPGESTDDDADGDPACSDCDDSDINNSTEYSEICDGQDNDCVGGADFDAAGEVDSDGDLVLSCDDCDDTSAATYPGNPEVCDGEDNDCIGGADFDSAGEVDVDGDGDLSCSDCDDADPLAFVGNLEQCTDTDSDCSGVVDDYLAVSYSSSPGSSIGPSANTTTTDTITIVDAGFVSDLNLHLDITHTWIGDLDISVTSPAGTTVLVFDEDQVNGNADDFTNTVFDDEGANPAISGTGAAPYTGSWEPENPLSAFDGESITGVWTLTILDNFNNDGGTLDSWSLDLFPDGYGDVAECGGASCLELIDLDPSASGGDYFLDFVGTGTGSLYSCEMSTDGGGWIQVLGFNREDDGDDVLDFEAEWDALVNDMGVYQTTSDSIQWQDGDFSDDLLDASVAVSVPNGGELLFQIHFEGTSMEDSGVWFTATTDEGGSSIEELWCNDDASANTVYSAAELAAVPYACSQSYTSSPDYDPGLEQTSFGGEITGLGLTSLMSDANGGDDAQLFIYEVWVR